MTRKETIIIAVLINAGLLVILFATALNPKAAAPSAPEAQIVMETAPELPRAVQIPVAGVQSDEVDQMLSKYSSVIATESATPQPVQQTQMEPSPKSELTVIETVEVSAPLKEGASSQFVEVKVKKGDVLEKIARSHHCKVDDIMRLNNLSSTRLKIGQSLKVPTRNQRVEKPVSMVAQTPASATNTPSEAKYYTVKNGDNLWTIAVKNHMKVEELLRLNHFDEEKAKRLKPGDQIRIK